MAFLDERLSDNIERGSKGGPTGSRVKVYTQSGRLRQHFNRLTPLHRYDVSFGIATKEDFEAVRGMFFVVLFTPYEGFRFRDWNDYAVTREVSAVETLAGAGDEFKLHRRYAIGAAEFFRRIAKPTPADLELFDAAGNSLTFSLDEATGILSSVSGTPVTWSGTFDVPVTFANDSLDAVEIEGVAGVLELQKLSSIELEEIIIE